jgi:ATP-binding cassette subfamily C (CFTR/MRP) protein 1
MWSSPLQVALALHFIYQKIGFAVFVGKIDLQKRYCKSLESSKAISFVGLGFLVISMPLNVIAWLQMEKYQRKHMSKKDERVSLISEILSNIKFLKFYAWERYFLQRVNAIREEELRHLRTFQYVEGTQYFFWSSSTLIMALLSFATFALSGAPEQNALDAQTVFVSLALFNMLRQPLFMLPLTIVSTIQAVVAARRISTYLQEEELDDTSSTVCYIINIFKYIFHIVSF